MVAVDKLIAEVRANPPHPKSPLPWKTHAEYGDVSDNDNTGVVADIEQANAAHIAAAVNAVGPLVEEVERLRVNLKASERLRAMEAQAVAQAIRQPGEPQPSRFSVICALRGVTLPKDFLPVAERILVENEELREEANFYRELHNKTCLTVDKFVYGSCNCRLSVQIERNRSAAVGTSSET